MQKYRKKMGNRNDCQYEIVNNNTTTLSLAPKIIEGTTMVPIRFVSQNLNANVNWDSASRTVRISNTVDITKQESVTQGQKNALQKAKSYLQYSSFSRDGLIKQLEYEKFTHEEAVYAVDHCGADWYAQALQSAKTYLKYSSFSYNGLINQLENG